ncbi:MAG: hypothetical protein A2046_11530 [Bacteroidetes bacterium GWA2_30_7]|nr:MAG: hypothetical protein A2046_11530 [Bacteroidetes bacterium GWA2_30_7]
MNKMNKLNLLTVLLVVTTLFSACIKEDFDKPPINIPTIDFDTTHMISIANLKIMYQGALNFIDTDMVAWGRVSANDESGNLYKTMEIQDASAGIELKLDRNSLFNQFHVGQRIYIKLKGMYIGEYNGLKQLGYNYNNAIGRMPDALIDQHLFLDSLPGAPVQPKVININAIDEADLSKLVKVEGVSFELPGSPYTEGDVTTNRNLVDANGVVIPGFLLRTSNYSTFAANLLPAGKGNLVGILSRFGSDWQFYIRDLNDVQNFIVPTVLFNYSFAANSSDWTVKNEAGNNNWFFFSGDPGMAVTGFGSDAPCKDWLISPEVDLGTAPNSVLTFKSIMKYSDSGITNPLKIKISSNYTGDVSTASWDTLSASISTSGSWTTNSVSGFPSSGKYRIAFYYESSGTSNTTATQWQIKEVKLAN